MQKALINVCIIVSILGCGSTQKTTTTDNNSKTTQTVSPSDDPFFKETSTQSEVFRVLIVNNTYIVRQMSGDTDLIKKVDASGDKEQLTRFQELGERYDFKDWEFNGVLSVRLHPHRGEIEHIEFVPGLNPKTWQASKLFQEDVSRFAFQFPKGQITLRDFRVRYRWKIPRRPGLTDEEAKKRALEFLKSETQH